MVQIKIQTQEKENGWSFQVTIKQDGTQTNHRVEMSQEFYRSLDTEVAPEEIVKKSFEFLLENEPKEAIFPQFNIKIIGHYFPEYKQELKSRLS